MDEYFRLERAGFHPLQAQALVRVAAEVSRLTDPDPYCVAMALRDARGHNDGAEIEGVRYRIDNGWLTRVLAEDLNGSLNSDKGVEAREQLAKSLDDNGAYSALMEWVSRIRSLVNARRKAARKATFRKRVALVAAVVTAVSVVVAATVAVMQAFF